MDPGIGFAKRVDQNERRLRFTDTGGMDPDKGSIGAGIAGLATAFMDAGYIFLAGFCPSFEQVVQGRFPGAHQSFIKFQNSNQTLPAARRAPQSFGAMFSGGSVCVIQRTCPPFGAPQKTPKQ